MGISVHSAETLDGDNPLLINREETWRVERNDAVRGGRNNLVIIL